MLVQSPDLSCESTWLDDLLRRLPEARVAVFGDLCLDAYWFLDEARPELSLETGLEIHRVATQRYSPGGAGNVAVNLVALGVRQVEVIGLVGQDPFGDELVRQLAARGLAVDGVLRGPSGWQTLVYAKPYRGAAELNRLDFGGGNAFSAETWSPLLARLHAAAARCPVVIVNQQVPTAWSAAATAALGEVITAHPGTLFIVDSRHHAGALNGTALKLNAREAAQILGAPSAPTPGDALCAAEALARKRARPVLVTRGAEGLVLATAGGIFDIPGIELPGAADPVGAGDTALAAFAAGWAAGADPLAVASLANLAAALTSRQLRTTGTATPARLRAVGPSPDYVHQPRLAAQPRLARFDDGTNLEIVSGRRPRSHPTHAILDHDGTLSTLRQGWEAIMAPMMLRAILGPRADNTDDATHERVSATVRAFIDRTTGIQTLAQMKGLVDLVREFAFVPPGEVLDEHSYKALYNAELLALVRDRLRQMERGELSPGDWQIKNAGPLLERLRAAGLKLYLASGTDEADVIAEARSLGYASLFDGIHGAVGDLRVEAKREVLRRIVRASAAEGAHIVVFGDGPVEIREARRHGAYAVGLATDELRRHGLDPRKRARLIRAGADIVIPDFSQLDALLAHLGLAHG